jgi:hypothetical protein
MRRRQLRFLQAILDQPPRVLAEAPFPDHHDMMLCGCVIDTNTSVTVTMCEHHRNEKRIAAYNASMSIAA